MWLERYNKIRLHKNSLVDKRIRALFLLYDKESIFLNHFQRLKMIDHYIHTLIESEEYEAAEAFINRRHRKIKKYRRKNRKWTLKLIFRFLLKKLF